MSSVYVKIIKVFIISRATRTPTKQANDFLFVMLARAFCYSMIPHTQSLKTLQMMAAIYISTIIMHDLQLYDQSYHLVHQYIVLVLLILQQSSAILLHS